MSQIMFHGGKFSSIYGHIRQLSTTKGGLPKNEWIMLRQNGQRPLTIASRNSAPKAGETSSLSRKNKPFVNRIPSSVWEIASENLTSNMKNNKTKVDITKNKETKIEENRIEKAKSEKASIEKVEIEKIKNMITPKIKNNQTIINITKNEENIIEKVKLEKAEIEKADIKKLKTTTGTKRKKKKKKKKVKNNADPSSSVINEESTIPSNSTMGPPTPIVNTRNSSWDLDIDPVSQNNIRKEPEKRNRLIIDLKNPNIMAKRRLKLPSNLDDLGYGSSNKICQERVRGKNYTDNSIIMNERQHRTPKKIDFERLQNDLDHLRKSSLYPYGARYALFQVPPKYLNSSQYKTLRNSIADVIYAFPELDAKLSFTLFADNAHRALEMSETLDWWITSVYFNYLSRFDTKHLLFEYDLFQKIVFDNDYPVNVRRSILNSMVSQVLRSPHPGWYKLSIHG